MSNQLDRMDYVGHNGLLWPAKGPLWWKLGPPGKSGVAPWGKSPNDASGQKSAYLGVGVKFSKATVKT